MSVPSPHADPSPRPAKTKAEPIRILTEPRRTPVSPPVNRNPLAKQLAVRTDIDAETGKVQTVVIDPNTGIATPVTAGVPPPVQEYLAAEAATAIRPTPSMQYVWNEETNTIQTVFTDAKTGKVLHKSPDDATLTMNAILREWATVGLDKAT